MKSLALGFLRRGMTACGIGPVVLSFIYLILRCTSGIEVLSVNQVCVGIFSLTALAFIAGGMNVVYQIERLPLMAAIFVHGAVLYVSYLATYFINGWLEFGALSLAVFTVIFIVGYIIIWATIYSVIKRNTDRLNKMRGEQQQRR